MVVQGAKIGVTSTGCGVSACCVDKFGCPSNRCPDFVIKRHDTKPPFKVQIEDCEGPLDLTDLIVEASMWAKGKLKTAIDNEVNYFGLADGIGFEQANVGDIVVMERVRSPEYMLITGFDETNKLIEVQRGYNGTPASAWTKGTPLKIFRFINASAETEAVTEDIEQLDGTTLEDQLIESYFVYEWDANDTCLPGCYWLEFKLIKMDELSASSLSILSTASTSSVTPSFIATDPGCGLGTGVEWMRRFPADSEGFLIKIVDTPTSENIS